MTAKEIRSFDYVNQPYERVTQRLEANAAEVFRSATRAATARGEDVASELRLDVSGFSIGTAIEIAVCEIERSEGDAMRNPAMRVRIEWQAVSRPSLFPVMKADVSVYPLTRSETQLEFSGHYDPPLGALGSAIDRVAGHRIAEACVHRFVSEVAQYLRDDLST